jgi:hypothetical protein
MSMKENTVYVIQEIAGTREGKPKINIMGASHYGNLKFLLPELNGKYKLLKWDKQEKKYYPINVNLYEKGEIDEH